MSTQIELTEEEKRLQENLNINLPRTIHYNYALERENNLISNYALPCILSIQYPGIVINIDKAIKRLGGQFSINNCWYKERKGISTNDIKRPNPKASLNLSFRPDDVTSHPIVSDDISQIEEHKVAKTLYIVGKKYRRFSKSKNCYVYKTKYQFVGYSPFTYEFNSLCDFQILPIDKKSPHGFLSEMGVQQNTLKSPEFYLSNANSFWAVPTKFSKFTKNDYCYNWGDVTNQSFKYENEKRLKEKEAEEEAERQKKKALNLEDGGEALNESNEKDSSTVQTKKSGKTWESLSIDDSIIGRGRKFRGTDRFYHYNLGMNFDDLQKPSEQEIKNFIKTPKNRDCVNAIKKLFQERPIWLFSGIESRLYSFNYEIIKHSIILVAYHIKDGPWQRCWCVYDYNPMLIENCNEAKKYQVVDFRYNNNIPSEFENKINGLHKQDVSKANLNELKKSIFTYVSKLIEYRNYLDLYSLLEALPDDPKIKDFLYEAEKNFMFKSNIISPRKQMYYQLIDIEMPAAQNACLPVKGGIIRPFHKSSGWFNESDNIIDKVRKETKSNLEKTVNNCIELLKKQG